MNVPALRVEGRADRDGRKHGPGLYVRLARPLPAGDTKSFPGMFIAITGVDSPISLRVASADATEFDGPIFLIKTPGRTRSNHSIMPARIQTQRRLNTRTSFWVV
jgi:hypothetical protein